MFDPNTADEDAIGSGIFGRTPSDLKPLVELLRSERPIPVGIRHMLAEMIDPQSAGYLHLRLVLNDCSTRADNSARDLEKMQIVAHYSELVRSGMTSQVAALETAEKFMISDRSVYRFKDDVEKFLDWLQPYSRGTDKN